VNCGVEGLDSRAGREARRRGFVRCSSLGTDNAAWTGRPAAELGWYREDREMLN
jgi:hypothetical protein